MMRGAGGTQGRAGQFLLGLAMMCGGFYLLLNAIAVNSSFGLGAHLFGATALGGAGITTGMLLIPLLIGIGLVLTVMETISRSGVCLVVAFVATGCATAATQGTVRGDFDGDGALDEATIFQHSRHVTLVIRRAAAVTPETFEFRVDPAAQDAICTLPAELSTSPSLCTPMDELLPGCREVAGKRDLSISDGACDAIHLYWDGEAKRMAWWRL